MPTSEPPAEWYHTCSHFPLNLFIEVIEKHNIKALIISGLPTEDQLYESWASIYYEFVDLNANNEQSYIYLLKKEVAILIYTITTVEHALYFFSIEPSRELANIINDNGFEFTFLPENYQTNINEVECIRNQLAPMKMRLKMREQELKDYIENREKDNVEGSHFTKMLWRIGKLLGYRLLAKDLMVTEYVELLHYYLEELKSKKEVMEDAN